MKMLGKIQIKYRQVSMSIVFIYHREYLICI